MKDFWKNLWSMQKKMPIIEAHSFVSVYICSFMNNVCPLKKPTSSIDPKVIKFNYAGLKLIFNSICS